MNAGGGAYHGDHGHFATQLDRVVKWVPPPPIINSSRLETPSFANSIVRDWEEKKYLHQEIYNRMLQLYWKAPRSMDGQH